MGGQRAVLFVVLVVAAFVVEFQEAVERDRAAGCAQFRCAAGDVDGDLVDFCGLHLAGNGALPHQLVQPCLIGGEVARGVLRAQRHIGRPDRFVRFLRVLDFRYVLPGAFGYVAGPELLPEMGPDRSDRLLRHLHAVGAHVGDQPDRFAIDIYALVELLRHPHGGLRPHAQFAGGLLLQRRRGERRRRVAPDALALDRSHGERTGLDSRLGARGQFRVVEVELIELLAVQVGQPGSKGRALRRGEGCLHRPVLARPENLDLGFALTDQPQRHGLHAPGAAAAGQLAPQHGAQREPHQIVQRAAGHVGLDQRLIQLTRVGDGVAHGGAGDFVEADALHVHAAQGVLLLQHGAHVPRDRLALAVRVGGEIELLRALQGAGDGRDLAGTALVGLPVHGEIIVRTHAAVLGRQVAHVAETGQHRVAIAQILVDGLGFGWGFYDYYVGHGKS